MRNYIKATICSYIHSALSQMNHATPYIQPTPDARTTKNKIVSPRGEKEKSSNQPHNLPRPLPPPNHSPRRHATPHWRQNPNLPLVSIHVRDVQKAHDTRIADFSGRGMGGRVGNCEEGVGEICWGWWGKFFEGGCEDVGVVDVVCGCCCGCGCVVGVGNAEEVC